MCWHALTASFLAAAHPGPVPRSDSSDVVAVIQRFDSLMAAGEEAGGWNLRAIHWSSRSRRPPPG